MKMVTAAEMRAIDRATSERFHVPSLTLMENAGSAVARFIVGNYPQAERIGIVCGKGNNGGDGFVVARKLTEAGRAARVLLLADPKELRGDAAIMFEHMKLTPIVATTITDLGAPEASEIFASDLIVDAILGTGFRPPVGELYTAAIAKMNASTSSIVSPPIVSTPTVSTPIAPTPIVAIDVPSGADADSDSDKPATGSAARADDIVTFTAPRPAHVFAALTNGPTVVAPIGSPDEAIVSELNLNLSTPADFRSLLAPRQSEANKGSYGHVLVIGGSLGKAGAAAMAGFSALRAGAGLSTIATPKSILRTVASFHPDVMTEPLPETFDGTIGKHALESAPKLVERKTVVAIGPGISRNLETAEFVRFLLTPGMIPADIVVVLDADALNAFEGTADQLNGRGRHIVITPHPGEMSRLTGLSIAEIQANRLEVARKFARDHQLIVVLKGHRTLIASPDGAVWVNATGNPGMATGGTGDILTGIVSGLIAQHPQNISLATALAVYLHGLAGDLAAESLGEHSLVATDLVRFLPESFRQASESANSAEFRFHA